MKHYVRIIIALIYIAATISLAACQTGTNHIGTDTISIDPKYYQKMKIQTISSGIAAQIVAASDDNIYKLRPYINGTANIIKYDVKTCNMDFLSNGEKAVLIDDIMGGGVPVTVDDFILVFKLGHVAQPIYNYPGVSSGVYRLRQNGEYLGFTELKSNWLFKPSSSIASNDESIYAVLQEYDVEQTFPELSDELLCQIDIQSGSLTVIAHLGIEKDHVLIGAYNDGVVLLTSDPMPEDISKIDDDPIMIDILLYSLTSNELKDTGVSWINGKRSGAFDNDGNFYYFEYGNGKNTLFKCELETNTIVELIADVNITEDNSLVPYLSGGIYDNRLVASLENEDRLYNIYIDVKTNTVIHNTLQYTDEGNEACDVMIFEETEKYFFVMLDRAYIPTVQTDNGETYRFDECVEIFMLITKEDFWSSIPNYISFNDMVYNSNEIVLS